MIKDLIKRLASKLIRENGQGMVEYAMIIALIALALVLALGEMGTGLLSFFSSVSDKIANL